TSAPSCAASVSASSRLATCAVCVEALVARRNRNGDRSKRTIQPARISLARSRSTSARVVTRHPTKRNEGPPCYDGRVTHEAFVGGANGCGSKASDQRGRVLPRRRPRVLHHCRRRRWSQQGRDRQS